MEKNSYDATLKGIVDPEPGAWLPFLGLPSGVATVVDSDVGTVTGAADKVIHVQTNPEYMLHLEFVAGHDAATLAPLVLARNTLLGRRHNLPILSTIVVLHPEANSPQLTGNYQKAYGSKPPYLKFEYTVVRVWKVPVASFLTGGLTLLPLAPIAAVTESDLPDIITQMESRLRNRRARPVANLIWDSALLLCGLRYSPELIVQLFQGVMAMKESSMYQYIRNEGMAEGVAQGQIAEAKRILRLMGEGNLGPPDARTTTAIERMTDLAQIESLLSRVLSAESWNDLVGATKRGRRKKS